MRIEKQIFTGSNHHALTKIFLRRMLTRSVYFLLYIVTRISFTKHALCFHFQHMNAELPGNHIP